jgi:hypothetical protein
LRRGGAKKRNTDGKTPKVIAAYFTVPVSLNSKNIDDDLLDDYENVLSMVSSFFTNQAFEAVADPERFLFLRSADSDHGNLIAGLDRLVSDLEARPAPHPAMQWKLCLHADERGRDESGWSATVLDTENWAAVARDGLALTEAARDMLGLAAQTKPAGEGVFELIRRS